MIAPRKFVQMLLILLELAIITACLIMIVLYEKRPLLKAEHKIWIGSKILTVNELIKQNNYEIYPILDINSDNEKIFYKHNYESLLKHSNNNCENNYKKCGILDTLGNIMCIPENEECPINEVIVDFDTKYDEYVSKGYKVAYLENITEGYALYYTNKATDNEIVAKLNIFDSYPKYISEENFIFDEDIFKSKTFYYGYSSDDDDDDDRDGWDWDDDDDWGGGGGGWDWDDDSGGGGFRILEEEEEEKYGNSIVTSYIYSKFNEEKNLDKSLKNVSENLYIGNYLGFSDYNSMSTFMDINLHYLYFSRFPNYVSMVFCYICIIFLIILIICSLCRFFHEDKPNEGYNKCRNLIKKLCIIIPYLIFFIGYFIYIIYSYCFIYINSNFDDIAKVNADEFLEDLMTEVKERHDKKEFHLAVISLFSFSVIAFLLAWTLSQIFTNRYLKLVRIAQQTDQIYRRGF